MDVSLEEILKKDLTQNGGRLTAFWEPNIQSDSAVSTAENIIGSCDNEDQEGSIIQAKDSIEKDKKP